MTEKRLLARWWARVLIIFGIWTLFGLIDTSQTIFITTSRGDPMPFGWALFLGVSDWYTWALLTPLVVWLARRFPLENATPQRLLLHTGTSFLTALTVVAVALPVY